MSLVTMVSRYLTLLLLPGALLLATLAYDCATDPHFGKFKIDSDYRYLFSSLNMACGHRVVCEIHPGLTVTYLGAAIIRIAHLCAGHDDIVTDVLSHPTWYLHSTTSWLSILAAASLVLAGIVAFRATESLLHGLIVQSAPAFFVFSYVRYCVKTQCEPVLLIATGCFAAALMPLLATPRAQWHARHALWCAAAMAFGIATKLNFGLLMVIPLIALPGIRLRLWFLGGTIVATAVLLMPAWQALGILKEAILTYVMHTGVAGKGGCALVQNDFVEKARDILAWEPRYAAILAGGLLVTLAAAVAAALTRGRAWSSRAWVLCGLVVGQVLQFAAVARSGLWFHLLPGWGMSGATLVAATLVMNDLVPRGNRWLVRLPGVLVGCIAVWALARSVRDVRVAFSTPTVLEAAPEKRAIDAKLHGEYARAVKIFCYDSTGVEAGLYFGRTRSSVNYASVLAARYPRSYAYLNNTCYGWDRSLSFSDLVKRHQNEVIVVVADPQTAKPPGELEDVFHGKHHSIYLVHTRSAPAKGPGADTARPAADSGGKLLSGPAPRYSMVRNGAFADGMSNWTWWMEAQRNNALVETTQGMLRIHNPGGVLAGVRQIMTVESGAVYRLGGIVRSVVTNDGRTAFGARIAFFLPPQREQHVVWMTEYNYWLPRSTVFTNLVAGVATVYAHVGFGGIATTAEFSSVSIEKVE